MSDKKNENLIKIDSDTMWRHNNHIWLCASIDNDSANRVTRLIREAEDVIDTKIFKLESEFAITEIDIPIVLHIRSYGGIVLDAFAIIDILANARYPVDSVIEGYAASAATLISCTTRNRYITKNAYMLIHQLWSVSWGKFNELQDDFDNCKEFMRRINNIYEQNTKLTKKELKEVLKHDLWFTAKKCVKKGLVDEII